MFRSIAGNYGTERSKLRKKFWAAECQCNHREVEFARALDKVLPSDLPERSRLVELGSQHLKLIVAANREFNLTRILTPEDAAVKHVLDSVLPWRHFAASKHVLDAGTGAGFPGIPLAIVLPEVRFTLAESIGKKARFVQQAVGELTLTNVTVVIGRAEDLLRSTHVPVITARAVAPLQRAAPLFGKAVRHGSVALLYKGPDPETEIMEAAAELKREKLRAHVLERFTLPEDAGTRTLVELTSASKP